MKKKIVVQISFLVFLISFAAIGFMPVLVRGEGEDSSTAPVDYEPEVITEPIIMGSDVLIILDYWPWGYHTTVNILNEIGQGGNFNIIPTGALGSTDLSKYEVVIISSDQRDWSYNNIIAQKTKLANFVSAGGVLVAHACDEGWQSGHWGSSFLPGGVYHRCYWHPFYDGGVLDNHPHIVMSGHPIVTTPHVLTDGNLDNWGYSTHGYFINLLPGTNTIIRDSEGRPIYIEYQYGAGLVLATMMTMEYADPDNNWDLLRNELDYLNLNRPPMADAGLDQNLEQTSHAGAVVMLDGSGSSDPDGDELTYTWTWSGGSAMGVNPTVTFPLGTTIVTLTVSDGALDDSDTVDINVVDTTPPVIDIAIFPIILWPPNHKYHTIEVSDFVISVSDICDADVGVEDVVITSVSSDEPENTRGGGDGHTWEDIIIEDLQTVLLRAERQGRGNGRVYTINIAVIDASGNTAVGSFQVWVPHDQWFVWMTTDDGPAAGYIEYP